MSKRAVNPEQTRCEMTQIVMPWSPNVYYIGKPLFITVVFSCDHFVTRSYRYVRAAQLTLERL